MADYGVNHSNPRGHVWKAFNEDVEGDEHDGLRYEFIGDNHTSRECARCGNFECEICDPDFLQEDCPDFGNELPGLEF